VGRWGVSEPSIPYPRTLPLLAGENVGHRSCPPTGAFPTSVGRMLAVPAHW